MLGMKQSQYGGIQGYECIVVHGKIRDVTLNTRVRTHVQLSCIGAVIKTLCYLGVVIAATYLIKA